MNPEAFWKKLLPCQSESEVSSVLTAWQDKEDWLPLGGSENNFGVIENQQTEPPPAILISINLSADCANSYISKKLESQNLAIA